MNQSEKRSSTSSRLGAVALCLAIGVIFGSGTSVAGEFKKTYEFQVDEWHEIETTDGAVTLHRIRLDRKEDRLTKSAIARPLNQEYLQPVRFQLDYTNGSSQKWRARILVRWLDEDGRIIDGFSANESLDKKSARKVAQASVSTLSYGLERAKKFEVEIRFEP